MAKQAVNVVERHLEKGILGLCVAVLIGSIVTFLVSSPNKIEIGGDLVGPSEIDDRALNAANQLRDRLRNARPEEADIAEFVPEFENALSPLRYASIEPLLPISVPWLPPVPDVIDDVPIEGEIRLAKVIKPSRLRVTQGRSTVFIQPPIVLGDTKKSGFAPDPDFEQSSGLGQGVDVNWVTVGCLFDQKEQISIHQQAGYKAGRQSPYLLGVDLERRRKNPNGTYTPWAEVQTYNPTVLPTPPTVELIPGPNQTLIASIDTETDLRDFFRLLKRFQANVFRPLFPEIQFGSDWLYPKYLDVENIRVEDLDWELCSPEDGTDCGDPRPYPAQSDIAPVTEAPKTGVALVEATLEEAMRYFDRGDYDRAIETAEDVNTMEGVRSNHLQQVKQIIEDARQRKRDAERGADVAKNPSDTTADDRAQRKSRYQVAWVHDLSDELGGGAQSGMTYQYRARFRLYNRFCGAPSELADAEDAKRIVVLGEWSAPGDDVHIAEDVAFFITHGNPSLGRGAKATVFKWFEGMWVSEPFGLVPGETIGKRKRTTGRQLPDGGHDRPQVDFSTGATVIDIDYDYTYRRKRQRGHSFELQNPRRTIAVMYVTSDGILRQKVMEEDKYGPQKKDFVSRLEKGR